MGAMRRHDSPTRVIPRSPKSDCHVGFADEVVTGYSRPLSNSEHWTLYFFEEHAGNCDQCADPLRIHKSGRQLCEKGHEHAVEVARLVYFSRSRDGVFSRTREDEREVRVEIPAKYVQTMGLLRAIQRALRNGDRFVQPKSFDRTYHVSARRPAAHDSGASSVSSTSDEGRASPRRQRSPDYAVKVVEPKQQLAARPRLADGGRGSLYGEDMEELVRSQKREQRLKYALEVREPSGLSYRRYG